MEQNLLTNHCQKLSDYLNNNEVPPDRPHRMQKNILLKFLQSNSELFSSCISDESQFISICNKYYGFMSNTFDNEFDLYNILVRMTDTELKSNLFAECARFLQLYRSDKDTANSIEKISEKMVCLSLNSEKPKSEKRKPIYDLDTYKRDYEAILDFIINKMIGFIKLNARKYNDTSPQAIGLLNLIKVRFIKELNQETIAPKVSYSGLKEHISHIYLTDLSTEAITQNLDIQGCIIVAINEFKKQDRTSNFGKRKRIQLDEIESNTVLVQEILTELRGDIYEIVVHAFSTSAIKNIMIIFREISDDYLKNIDDIGSKLPYAQLRANIVDHVFKHMIDKAGTYKGYESHFTNKAVKKLRKKYSELKKISEEDKVFDDMCLSSKTPKCQMTQKDSLLK